MRDLVAENKVEDTWWVTAETDLCLPVCKCPYTNSDTGTSFHQFPKAQDYRPILQCLGLWRRLKVQPRVLLQAWYYPVVTINWNSAWPRELAYSQQHSTVVDPVPGTVGHGSRSRHFSPLQLVSLGKSACSVRKASGSHIPHENRKSTDAIMETGAEEESQLVNKAMWKA